MENPKGALNVKELAAYLGVGLNVAYGLVRTPGFPALKIGERRIVVPIDSLNQWINDNAGKPLT